MERARLALALQQLEPSDGELFERLASAFATVDLPRLRTVASYSGDGGRDAFLYSPEGEEGVVLQYSVTKYTDDKIRRTARRLAETVPEARELIYVTCQEVGIQADKLRRDLRKEFALSLDVWDKNWFLDRVNSHPQREQAAEVIAKAKVDPLLASHNIISDAAPSLNTEEERCAVLYLTLQARDEELGKGLTKVAFESLVRAALRDTSGDDRMSRADVHRAVASFVPGQDPRRFAGYVNNALLKLSKGVLRHWQAADEFCLSNDERARLASRMSALKLMDADFETDLDVELGSVAAASGIELTEAVIRECLDLMHQLVDTILHERGERFAGSIVAGSVIGVETQALDRTLDALLKKSASRLDPRYRGIVQIAVQNMLNAPTRAARQYLRRWTDSHTLFALLRESPDVQKTVVKLFSSGKIWLDANLLLPVFAEILSDESARNFTNLLLAARDCGLSLFVTSGIVEELSMQMRRSIAYARVRGSGKAWDGKVPFLYSAYVLSGASPDTFAGWISNFRGEVAPEEDVAEYLREVFGIRVRDIEEALQVHVDIRGALQEIWYEVKERSGRNFSPESIDRLVKHDVECYAGVIALRKRESRSTLGYNTWWVTLDRTAYRVHRQLADRISGEVPASPVMSPDFLLNYLEIGPLRTNRREQTDRPLPVVMDISVLEGVSEEVLRLAERIRLENAEAPPRVVRRKIRDAMDAWRGRAGELSEGGAERLEEEVLASITAGTDGTDRGV